MSLAFHVSLSAETKRRIRARQSERDEPLSESDLRAVLDEAETVGEDALYRAYCEAVGEPLVELPPEEMAAIRDGLRKGELVEREIAGERDREAREFAERERQEQADADALWPAYKTALGPCGGYE